MGEPARGGRRPQPGRLRRAAGQRARRRLRGPRPALPGVIRRHGRARRARDDRQRARGYRSREFNDALSCRGVAHRYTRPYSPLQNGKVERMNRIIAQEWQYGRAWSNEEERAEARPPSSSTTIGCVRTAPAGASRPCRASSA